jgi:pimeloyl-ACP methyl ester carboxylesterase
MQRRAFELQQTAHEGAAEELLVPDLARRLSGITAPTAVAVGAHDAPDFHAIGARLAGALPEARLTVLPGTAHVPYFEGPDVFDPWLTAVLDDLVPLWSRRAGEDRGPSPAPRK